MELLIGMIISSIVISFGYAAYAIIYKQYLGYKDVKAKMMETTQLYNTLSDDMRTADIVSFNENTLLLYHKNTSGLQYNFYDDFIVRTERELTDTFKIVPLDMKQRFLFPGNTAFVQQFSFEVNTLGEKEYFNFVKNYSSETLMNYKTLTEIVP